MGLGLVIIVFLFFALPKKNRKEKIIEFILNGLIFTLVASFLFQFLIIPLLTPQSDITATCMTSLTKSQDNKNYTIIIIKNAGESGATSFYTILSHSEKSLSMHFIDSFQENFCKIETVKPVEADFNKIKISKGHQTIISCDYIPPNFFFFIEAEGWTDSLDLTYWSKEQPLEEISITCDDAP